MRQSVQVTVRSDLTTRICVLIGHGKKSVSVMASRSVIRVLSDESLDADDEKETK